MANVYFFNNQTKTDCVYVRNTGKCSLDINVLVDRVCKEKKWEASDKVIIMLMNTENLVTYIYQNGKYDIVTSDESCMEIETNEEIYEEEDDNFNYNEDDYEDYMEDYDIDEMDDRYDEREDDYGYDGGYEDEFYECCDIY